MNRQELEKLALSKVSPELYYDAADNIDNATDQHLRYIIRCNGDYDREMMYDSYTEDVECRGDDSAKYEGVPDDDMPEDCDSCGKLDCTCDQETMQSMENDDEDAGNR